MRFLRTNTAVRITIGPAIDKTDGLTPKDTLTVANLVGALCYDADDGDAVTVTHFHPAASGSDNDMVSCGYAGMWDLELTAANLNFTGRMMLAFTDKDQICPIFHEFQVLSANVYDSLFAGHGQTADLLDVSVTQLGGTAQSLTDLKDFADTGYDPSTHKVQGVVLTDTVTTYTGNTLQTGDSYAVVKSGGSGDNAAIKAKTDNLPASPASTTNITAGTITTVTNLTNAPTNGDFTSTMKSSITAAVPTAATISDAVWDEAIAGHAGAGSTGVTLSDILTDTGTTLDGKINTIDTVVDLIEDIVRNKMEVTDANGNVVLYADDGSTPLYSVPACLTDDSTTTIRKRLA